jgi:hypothetical protein
MSAIDSAHPNWGVYNVLPHKHQDREEFYLLWYNAMYYVKQSVDVSE